MSVHYAPHMLPKVRSDEIRGAVRGWPCTLRIASFIPGHQCAGDDTTVLCHLTGLGKGMSTKVTDIAAAAGCAHCHALVDRVDSRVRYIEERYPAALADRYMQGMIETLTLLVTEGVIVIPRATILK